MGDTEFQISGVGVKGLGSRSRVRELRVQCFGSRVREVPHPPDTARHTPQDISWGVGNQEPETMYLGP